MDAVKWERGGGSRAEAITEEAKAGKEARGGAHAYNPNLWEAEAEPQIQAQSGEFSDPVRACLKIQK